MRVMAAMGAMAVGAAASADDAAQGRALVERWCAECHVTAEGQAVGADAAPSFPALAQDPARTEAWLRGWLADPHPPMPDPGLSREQIDAVVAYLAALRG